MAAPQSSQVSSANISDPRHPQFEFDGTRYEYAAVTNGAIIQVFTVQSTGEKKFVGSVLPDGRVIPTDSSKENDPDVVKAKDALAEYDHQHPQTERQKLIAAHDRPSVATSNASAAPASLPPSGATRSRSGYDIELPAYVVDGTTYRDYIKMGPNGPTSVHEVATTADMRFSMISDSKIVNGKVSEITAYEKRTGLLGQTEVDQKTLASITARVEQTVLKKPEVIHYSAPDAVIPAPPELAAPPPIPERTNGRRPLNGVLSSGPSVPAQASPSLPANGQVIAPVILESSPIQLSHDNWDGKIVATRTDGKVTGLDVKESESGTRVYRNIKATVDDNGGAHITDLLVRTPGQLPVFLHLEGTNGEIKVYDGVQHEVIGSDNRPHLEHTQITDPEKLKQYAPFIDAAKKEAERALTETKTGVSVPPVTEKPGTGRWVFPKP